FGIHGHTVPVGVLAGERVAQPLGSPGDGVLVHVVRDGARGGVLQDVGRGEVGEPLRQVDGIVLAGEPGHATDHRFGEPVGAPGSVHGEELTTRKAPARLPGPSILLVYSRFPNEMKSAPFPSARGNVNPTTPPPQSAPL